MKKLLVHFIIQTMAQVLFLKTATVFQYAEVPYSNLPFCHTEY